MICPNCGNQNKEGQKFCSDCGALLPDNVQVNYQQPVQKPARKLDNKKILTFAGIGVAALVFIIFFVSTIKKCGKSDDKYAAYKIDEKALVTIKENGKYGFINTKGKVVIKPQFDEVYSDFIGGYALVKSDNKYKLIDKSGKTKMENEYATAFDYDMEYNTWLVKSTLYNSKLKALSKPGVLVSSEGEGYYSWTTPEDKKAGIMNYKGKITYKRTFKDGEEFSFDIDSVKKQNSDKNAKTYCLINVSNKKYAVVNCATGKEIYKMTENRITSDSGTIYKVESSDYKFIEKFIILNNKVVYKTDDSKVRIENYGTYIEVDNDGEKTYYLKSNGKKTTDKPSKSAEKELSIEEELLGLTKFSCDDGYGVMKKDKVVVKCEWENLKFFDVGTTLYLKSKGKSYALAKKDDKYKLINAKNGKTVKEFNTTSISSESRSIFLKYVDKDSKEVVIYNLGSGKTKKFDKDSDITLHENYFTLRTDSEVEYYNAKFKSIYKTKK